MNAKKKDAKPTAAEKTQPDSAEQEEPARPEAVEAAGATDAAGADAPTEADPRIAELQQALEESRGEHLRARAEAENIRRRAESDVARAHKFALERFARDLLAVRDSLEQASLVETEAADGGGELLKNMREGLLLTTRQLDALLERYSIVALTPAPGEPFNPDHHQALALVESEQYPAQHIVQCIQSGYLLHERLLRPATVTVARGGAAAGAGAGAEAPADSAPDAEKPPHSA